MIYITQNYIAFVAVDLITGVKRIPFVDILNIELKKNKVEYIEIFYRDWANNLQQGSVPITTLKVKNLYNNLLDLWTLSLSHIQGIVSSQKRLRDGLYNEKHIAHYETFMGQRKYVNTKSDLVNYRMRSNFHKFLGLPMEEVILDRMYFRDFEDFSLTPYKRLWMHFQILPRRRRYHSCNSWDVHNLRKLSRVSKCI